MDFLLLAAETLQDSASHELLKSLLGSAPGAVFAIWYGWHTTTRTIPQLVADFRAELGTQRAFQQSQVDLYWKEHREENTLRRQEIKELVDAMHKVLEYSRGGPRGSADSSIHG